ncbi:hypothetical protein HAX54_046331 [Datura stramonium]|uniref:DUF4283 domain-containing protein n=1 Tax=Datura stramonium TaxID=4076 RepID=A0ABS8RPP9_DATST|nr:hypothetical protein [Datura stramonium]
MDRWNGKNLGVSFQRNEESRESVRLVFSGINLIRLTLTEDFVNLTSKVACFINSKDGCSYRTRPLIYNSKFKIKEETLKDMAWISFPNLLPTYYVKESLFLLASAVDLPKSVHIDIVDEDNGEKKAAMKDPKQVQVQIKFDAIKENEAQSSSGNVESSESLEKEVEDSSPGKTDTQTKQDTSKGDAQDGNEDPGVGDKSEQKKNSEEQHKHWGDRVEEAEDIGVDEGVTRARAYLNLMILCVTKVMILATRLGERSSDNTDQLLINGEDSGDQHKQVATVSDTSPKKILHDIVTHNVTEEEIQKAMVKQSQMVEEHNTVVNQKSIKKWLERQTYHLG